jgi:hypothetical protein
LLNHVRVQHQDIRPFICDVEGCFQYFAHHNSFKAHFVRMHLTEDTSSKPATCKTPTGETEYCCPAPACGRIFSNVGCLTRHLRYPHATGDTQHLWHLKGRSVLDLVEGGLSHEEAAGSLGIPVGTAKSRLAYARDVVRSNADVPFSMPSMVVCGKRSRSDLAMELDSELSDSDCRLSQRSSMAVCEQHARVDAPSRVPLLRDPFPDFCDDGQLPELPGWLGWRDVP